MNMKLMNQSAYLAYTGSSQCPGGAGETEPVDIPDTVNTKRASFFESLKSFLGQFALVILGVYCLIILIIRRIPFLLEKVVYLVLCAVEIPITVACVLVETDGLRLTVLIFFVIVEQTLSKIYFVNYVAIFCSK